MDLDSHSACLRALKIIARAARLCAGLEPESLEYIRSSEGAERSIERAQAHYDSLREGHAGHERQVRFVGTAVAEARACVQVLTESLAEPETLDRFASKIERAIARAEANLNHSSAPPTATAPLITSGKPPPTDQG